MSIQPSSGRPSETPDNVFFIHIPKTAGTAFGDVFCFAFQRFLPSLPAHDPAWRDVLKDNSSFFISGHFQFREIKDVVARGDVFSITLLRKPIDQLISHLKWVKAYGDPKRADKLVEIGPRIAELAVELWQTPLDDVDRMNEIVRTPVGLRLFDNAQTRSLCDAVPSTFHQSHVSEALQNLRALNLYFVLEDLDKAWGLLDHKFGPLEEIKNINTAMLDERPNLDDPQIFRFYEPFIRFDQILYEEAKESSRAKFWPNE